MADPEVQAMLSFDEKVRAYEEEMALESAKENLLTKKVLLKHIKRSIKVVVEDGYVEVRAKLSKKELDKFPNVREYLLEGNDYFKGMKKAKRDRIQKEINCFLSILVVSPKIPPEEIDSTFTPPQQTEIISEFLKSQASGISEELIQKFRT